MLPRPQSVSSPPLASMKSGPCVPIRTSAPGVPSIPPSGDSGLAGPAHGSDDVSAFASEAVVRPTTTTGQMSKRMRAIDQRTTGRARKFRFGRRIQATAAPPERVSHLLTNEGGAAMPKGHPLSETAKERIWELRAQGLSEREIARQLRLGQNTVSIYLRAVGGIRPPARRRAERCLTLEEREEISRAIAGGQSARAIARRLGRSHTTIAREIGRCGGRRRYRAHAAEREAWRRARRPGRPSSSSVASFDTSSKSASATTTPPSRSPVGCGSNTPTMRRCRSPTRRSIAPSTSRHGER